MQTLARLAFWLTSMLAFSNAAAAQTVIVAGAGSATANGTYKYLGDINSKPAYQNQSLTDFELAWAAGDDQWVIYNTADGKTYYRNELEIGTWVPQEGWVEEAGSSPPPVLSGDGTRQPLDGSYTVGGGGDFGSIAEAVDTLNSNGIIDDVTFLIAPGTYDEQVAISSYVSYDEPSDGVTLKPNSGLVTWNYTGVTGAGDNYFAKIDGASNVRIEELYFPVPGGATVFGRVIEYLDVDNLQIFGCTFEGIAAAADDNGSLIRGTGTNTEVLIQQNGLTAGYIGLDDTGDTDDLQIINNFFDGQTQSGILIDDGSDVVIEQNSVEDGSNSDAGYIGIDYSGMDLDVLQNDVEISHGTIGLEITHPLSGPTILLANNEVSVSSNSGTLGIEAAGSSHKEFYHNTIRMTSGAPASSTALRTGPVFSFALRNNILVHEGGGIALSSPSLLSGSDYNNLTTNGPVLIEETLGTTYATLADYQNATGKQLNSMSVSVTFVSSDDLHLFGSSVGDLDLIAPPAGGITEDIDGDVRDAYNVIMGADEGILLPPLDNGDTASGFYRVGGSIPREFDDPVEALEHLNSRGIKDPVTLKIRNSGGPWKINSIISDFSRFDGSDTDSVIVTSDDPVNPAVLEYAQTNADDNYLIKFDRAHDIELRDLVFQSTSVSTFGTLIEIRLGEDISIRGSEFLGLLGTSSSVTATSIYVPPGGTDSLTISDNYFLRSRYGIRTNDVQSGEYTGNTFRATYRGIRIDDGDDILISDNRLDSLNTGIIVADGGSTTIEANRADSVVFAIRLDETGTSQDGETLVANNFCSFGKCLEIVDSDSVRVYHNTFVTGTGDPVSITGTTSNVWLQNNIIGRLANARVLYEQNTPTAIIASDHNNLFNSGTFMTEFGGTTYTSLGDHQTGTGFDANSISKSVAFVDQSDADMHLTAASDQDLDLAAGPLGAVTVDFDDEARSPGLPYMGADELSAFGPGFEIDITILLEGPYSGGGTMSTLLNSGGHLESSSLVHPYGASPWLFSGGAPVPTGFFASNTGVVDWVYIVLYSGTLPGPYVFETAAVGLLLEDGSVVDPENPTQPPSLYPPSGAGSYYIGVFHRNHLAVVSASAVTFAPPGTVSASYDFTDGLSKAYGVSPMQDLGGGDYGLFSGDYDADGQVIANDFNSWLTDTKAGATGYLASDFNMDGQVNAADFNTWLANTKAGAASQVP